ncbi:energy transducer TonB [Myxococcus stipitatus]|uniref:energy transducer TonB n=1 Tax=Myxococcus stipitatus TaxID=83455 RepID=UPI0030D1CFF7
MPDASPRDGLAAQRPFASIIHARSRGARDLARTCCVVPVIAALHVVLLVGLDACWRGSPVATGRAEPEDSALVLRLLAAPPSPPSVPAVSAPSASRRATARRARPFPKPRPSSSARPSAKAPEEPPLAAAPPTAAPPGGAASGVPSGLIGGVVNSVLAASSAGLLPAAPPAPSRDELTAHEESYFKVMFRDRFEDMHYPDEAARAGLEGRFVLRITVGPRGQLLGLSVVGRCPHAILCDSAMAAVREAAPFPPPPARLGSHVTVEVPFYYHLLH